MPFGTEKLEWLGYPMVKKWFCGGKSAVSKTAACSTDSECSSVSRMQLYTGMLKAGHSGGAKT